MLQITDSFEVIVRVPFWVKDHQVLDIIRDKKDWIEYGFRRLKERFESGELHQYREGETFYYLGKPVKLVFTEVTGNFPARFHHSQLQVHKAFQKSARDIIKQLYRWETANIVNQRMPDWIEKTGLEPSSIKITWANKRWGSCSHKKRINFSYKLCMITAEAIDYIIVHELCHLVLMNHSKAFWKKVEEFYPDYPRILTWLKQNTTKFII